MKARQITRLEQMTEEERYAFIEEGLNRIAKSIEVLLDERESMAGQAPRSVEIVELVAAEEAAKGLLLVDYARPHSSVSDRQRVRHLRRFYDHLARGVYVDLYRSRPVSYGETIQIVERERDSHYLDGPEAVEWVFRNKILQDRESLLYVDLIEREDELQWLGPDSHPRVVGIFRNRPPPPPVICRFFLLLHRLGFLTAGPLRQLAGVWRDIRLEPATPWTECATLNRRWLERCVEAGLVERPEPSETSVVLDRLYFPLCGLDLSMREVLDDVEERRQRTLKSYLPY